MNQKIKDYLNEFRACEYALWHKSDTATNIAQQDIPQIKEDLLSLLEEEDFVIYYYAMSKLIHATHYGRYDVNSSTERPAFLKALSRYDSYNGFYSNGGALIKPWKEHIQRVQALLKTLIEEDALESFETDPRYLDSCKKYMELREKLINEGVIPLYIF